MPIAQFRRVNRLSALALAGTVGLTVFACGGGGNSTPTVPDPGIRFINTSADSTLDLFRDDVQMANDIAPGGSTNTFATFDPDSYDLILSPGSAYEELTNDFLGFSADTSYLLVAFGLREFTTEFEKRLGLTSIPIDRRAPVGSKSRVIAFHSYLRATGNPLVPITYKNPGTNPLISFPSINFGTSTIQEIDAGNTTLVVERTGTESEIARLTFNFQPGRIYFLYVSGVEGGTGANAPAIVPVEIATN